MTNRLKSRGASLTNVSVFQDIDVCILGLPQKSRGAIASLAPLLRSSCYSVVTMKLHDFYHTNGQYILRLFCQLEQISLPFHRETGKHSKYRDLVKIFRERVPVSQVTHFTVYQLK